MSAQKIKTGKKGGAKRITQKIRKIRETPLSQDVFRIVNDYTESEVKKPLKKIATPPSEIDLED
jgi:hypothetical protein